MVSDCGFLWDVILFAMQTVGPVTRVQPEAPLDCCRMAGCSWLILTTVGADSLYPRFEPAAVG